MSIAKEAYKGSKYLGDELRDLRLTVDNWMDDYIKMRKEEKQLYEDMLKSWKLEGGQ